MVAGMVHQQGVDEGPAHAAAVAQVAQEVAGEAGRRGAVGAVAGVGLQAAVADQRVDVVIQRKARAFFLAGQALQGGGDVGRFLAGGHLAVLADVGMAAAHEGQQAQGAVQLAHHGRVREVHAGHVLAFTMTGGAPLVVGRGGFRLAGKDRPPAAGVDVFHRAEGGDQQADGGDDPDEREGQNHQMEGDAPEKSVELWQVHRVASCARKRRMLRKMKGVISRISTTETAVPTPVL